MCTNEIDESKFDHQTYLLKDITCTLMYVKSEPTDIKTATQAEFLRVESENASM